MIRGSQRLILIDLNSSRGGNKNDKHKMHVISGIDRKNRGIRGKKGKGSFMARNGER